MQNTGLVGSNAWKDGCLNNCRAGVRGQNVKTIQKHSWTQAKESRNKIQKSVFKIQIKFHVILSIKNSGSTAGKKLVNFVVFQKRFRWFLNSAKPGSTSLAYERDLHGPFSLKKSLYTTKN